VTPKFFAVLIAVAIVVIAAYGIWYQRAHPRVIVKTGTVNVTKPGGASLVARTRTVQVGAVLLNEVELPGGTWIDCAGDCATAFNEAQSDFWAKQDRERR
jgi:hypothetical protein